MLWKLGPYHKTLGARTVRGCLHWGWKGLIYHEQGQVPFPALGTPGVVMDIYNFSTKEVEAEGPQGHPWLHGKVEKRRSYMKPFFKKLINK